MTQDVLTVVEAVRAAIVVAMRATGGDRPAAARLLMIGRTTLYRKLREFEIRRDEWL